jgi:hypothetical protein
VQSPVAKGQVAGVPSAQPTLGEAVSFVYAHLVGIASSWTPVSVWDSVAVTDAFRRPRAALVVLAPGVSTGV